MRWQSVVLLALLLVVFAVVPVSAGGRPLWATLTGEAEVPGPGDPDGSGTALITLNQGQEEVCYDISVSDIGSITAAHIHPGAAGQAGSPLVFFVVSDDQLSGCVEANAALIKDIRQNPSAYYVNVHTTEFPGGAIRGQLSK